jgi:hypothetical protein
MEEIINAVRKHEDAIKHHQACINNLIHRGNNEAVCHVCNETYDADDNYYGCCSKKCFNNE